MATWRKMIENEMSVHNDSFDNIVHQIGETENWLDINFKNGYGGTEGPPFTLWTNERVYFPVQYDGSEWVSSVPRNPNNEITYHVGGG